MAKQKTWMNIKQACKYAGVTRPTFNKWVDMGLRISKIGKSTYRVKCDHVDDFLESKIFEGNKTVANNIIEELMA